MLIALVVALLLALSIAALVAWVFGAASYVERLQEDRARDLAGSDDATLPPDTTYWP